VPRRRGKNTTLLSSMTLCGMGIACGGRSDTAVVFEAYVERVLAPSLREGQVVVMDDLGAHEPKRVRELMEERGCERARGRGMVVLSAAFGLGHRIGGTRSWRLRLRWGRALEAGLGGRQD